MISLNEARAKHQAANSSAFRSLSRGGSYFSLQAAALSLCLSLLLSYVFIHLGSTSRIRLRISRFKPFPTAPTSVSNAHNITQLKELFSTWAQHLIRTHGGVYTRRTACRENDEMAQACAFDGIVCINTSSTTNRGRPHVFLVDDSQIDGLQVPSDDWCNNRHQSSDPRYYSSRHWPLLERDHVVVPQQSCMQASYRTTASLFGDNLSNGSAVGMKWLPSIALLDFDFLENDHNGHFASDALWLLDTALFQKSLSLKRKPGYSAHSALHDVEYEDDQQHTTVLLSPNVKYYLPNTRKEFTVMTGRDVNRLLFATILQRNLTKLYPFLDLSQLQQPPTEGTRRRYTVPLLEAYPELDEILQFHGDLQKDNATDLVCTPRLTTGYKTGFNMHERTCRHIRTKAFEAFNVSRGPMKRVGQVLFHQPPKSVTVLNRHRNRKIANVEEVLDALRGQLGPLGVNVSYLDTNSLESAEEFVRVYSQTGIMISPHGSQNMAQMWMQRHAAMIEIMPVGYTEYSFNMLSVPCKTWFYELHSMALPEHRPQYEEECGKDLPRMYHPCISLKSKDVYVNVTSMIPVVLHALERLGYNTGHIWFKNISES